MKLIFRVIVCLSLFLLLACSQSNNTVAVGDTLSNRYAYVMQNKEVGSRWRPFLTQIDLASGEILNEIQVNYPYSYLTLLDNGDVLLTYSRDAKSLKRRVDKYSVKDNKVRSYIKTKAYYPSVVIPYNDQEFVLLDAHSSGDLLFEVFDEKGKYKQSLPIHNQSMCIYGSAISVEGNGNVWLFLDDFSDIEHDSIPVLLSLNLNTLKVKNITTDFMKDISSIDAAVFNRENKKIYLSSSSKEIGKNNNKAEINYDIYVYSYSDLKLLNLIPTGKQPGYMVFYPEQRKLYVSHGLSVSVIDTETETVIKTLPYHAQRIEKVSKDKVMIWHYKHIFGADPVTGANTTLAVEDQIVLLNVEDDTVVKSLDGHFGPISRNLNLHWNQGESK